MHHCVEVREYNAGNATFDAGRGVKYRREQEALRCASLRKHITYSNLREVLA
jgi:hypothetical protein